MRVAGVYIIRCHASGHAYVGASADLPERYRFHFEHLRSGSHQNPHLLALFREHGERSFQFVVAELLVVRRGGSHNGTRLGEMEGRWVDWVGRLVGPKLLNAKMRFFGGNIPARSFTRPVRDGIEYWPPSPRGFPLPVKARKKK